MIRKIFIGLFAMMALSVAAQEKNHVIDEVIWVVGDEAILKSDVEAARLEAIQNGQRWDKDPYCVIPEQLAVQKLFLHQAEIDSISVSDSELFTAVDNKLNAAVLDFGSREKFEEYMKMSYSQIRERMFQNAKDSKIVEQVQGNLVKDIKVTPSQVRRYFKDLPEDSIPFVPTKVECQILTLEPYIPQEEIDRVKDELRNYTERINNGTAQFSTLALLYSEDKASAQQGGELGFAGRGTFVPEFAKVAFNLTDPKAVSKIVETEYGFHIIQLIEKRGELANFRHILRKPKVSTTELQKCINVLDSLKGVIAEGKETFDDCVTKYSFDKDTRNNYGLLFDKNGSGESKYEMKDLPSEVARAVAGLKVGEVSAPFIMVNSKDKEVVAIAKLKTRVNGHRATMAEDYQEMQAVVLNKLCEDKLQEWIREKQKTTYVHIKEGWQNCEFQYPGWVK